MIRNENMTSIHTYAGYRYLCEFAEKSRNMFVPCSEAEIGEVINDKHVPMAFLEFLRLMGKGKNCRSNYFNCVSNYYLFYPQIVNLTIEVREVLREDNIKISLDKEAFVFMIDNQGVQWFFFRLDEGDNPPVYMYTEAREDRFDKICDSYTDFITGIAKADSTILHRLFG